MMRATGKYQTFDPLTPEEYAALEADVLERGVQVPIEFDEDGNVLDGHHRLKICRKHAITDYPSVVRRGLSEKEKLTHARTLNMARRHLTREQTQRQIQDALRENPGDGDRKLARSLRVDHKTVAAHRKKLVESGEIPHVEKTTGCNGMPYTRRSNSIFDANGIQVPNRLERLFSTVPEYRKLRNELTDIKRRLLKLGASSALMRGTESRTHARYSRMSWQTALRTTLKTQF